MAVDLTRIFAEYLAGNRGPVPGDPLRRQTPNYGVVATLEGHVLAVELTYRRGSAYCCYEWGCHVAMIDGQRWDGFRKRLAAHGIDAPPRIELRRTCVIEEGAVFYYDFAKPDPTRRGWYAFAPVQANRHEGRILEASMSGEPSAVPSPGH